MAYCEEHGHVWGQWWPKDKWTKYRQCLLCKHVEELDVKKS